jgi:anti-sigma regulatory factor (Ser/Thr protein kinase)
MRTMPGIETTTVSGQAAAVSRSATPVSRAGEQPVTHGRTAERSDLISASFIRRARRQDGSIAASDARKVREMRRIATACLKNWGLDHLTDPAELLVSELVTNALEHGDGTSVDLHMQLTPEVVHLAVSVGTSSQPHKVSAGLDSESGRGLFLVEWTTTEHSGAWGVSGDGSTTWCTLGVAHDDGITGA